MKKQQSHSGQTVSTEPLGDGYAHSVTAIEGVMTSGCESGLRGWQLAAGGVIGYEGEWGQSLVESRGEPASGEEIPIRFV